MEKGQALKAARWKDPTVPQPKQNAPQTTLLLPRLPTREREAKKPLPAQLRPYLRQSVRLDGGCHRNVYQEDAPEQGQEQHEVAHEYNGADLTGRAGGHTITLSSSLLVSSLLVGCGTRDKPVGEALRSPEIYPPMG